MISKMDSTTTLQNTLPWRIERRFFAVDGRKRSIVFVVRGYGGEAQYLQGPVQIGVSGWWTVREARAAIDKASAGSASALLRVVVGARFWDDHCDRCPCDGNPEQAMANEVGRTGSRVTVEGTPAQIENLRSDAAFYSDRWGPDECPLSLKRSAAATVAAIDTARAAVTKSTGEQS